VAGVSEDGAHLRQRGFAFFLCGLGVVSLRGMSVGCVNGFAYIIEAPRGGLV
jgi:hypothetical protein